MNNIAEEIWQEMRPGCIKSIYKTGRDFEVIANRCSRNCIYLYATARGVVFLDRNADSSEEVETFIRDVRNIANIIDLIVGESEVVVDE